MPRILFLFFSFVFLVGCFEKPVEKITEYHTNGQKKVSFWTLSDGTIRKEATWYNNGIQEYEIPYRKNEPHGEFIRWDVHGNVIAKGTYKNGVLDGEVTTFFVDKRKHSKSFYDMGNKVGTWQEFHFSGGLHFEKHFKNDSSVGVWKTWHKNGILQEENSCFVSSQNGFRKFYSENGKLSEEYDCAWGIKNGKSKRYYPGGNLKAEEFYKQGILDGVRLIYFANGKLQRKEHWKNGKRHLEWITLSSFGDTLTSTRFENGSGKISGFCFLNQKWVHCSDSLFKENKLDSTLTRFDFEKNLRYEENWHLDTLTSQKIYYLQPSEKLASEGTFRNGKPHGVWLNYHPNGQLKDSLNYKDGERFGHQKKFSEEGDLILHTEESGKFGPVLFHTSQER